MQYNRNELELSGKIVSDFRKTTLPNGEKVIRFTLQSDRKSGYADLIKVAIPFEIIAGQEDLKDLTKCDFVSLKGSLLCDTVHNEYGKHVLDLYAYAKKITKLDHLANYNNLKMEGYVCRPPILRKTPLNNIEICELFLAVQQGYKTNYIPCIVWNKNARFASKFNVGDYVEICGRPQSRMYNKIVGENVETKTTYEVSTNSIALLEKPKQSNPNPNKMSDGRGGLN